MDKIKVAYHYGESYLIMDKYKDELYTYNDDGGFEVLSLSEIDELVEYEYHALPKEAQKHVLKCKELFEERKGRTLVTGTMTIEFTTIVDSPNIDATVMEIFESDALIKKTVNYELPIGYTVKGNIHVDSHKKVF